MFLNPKKTAKNEALNRPAHQALQRFNASTKPN
jgi:hypothetical protein